MPVLSASLYEILRALGLNALARARARGGLVLCYHNVVAGTAEHLGGIGLHLPRHRFQMQMQWLAEHYAIVSLSEFVRRTAAGAPLRGIATITFDDAYQGVLEHALPVLRRLGLPATLFVVSEAAGDAQPFWWDHPAARAAAAAPRREHWLRALRGDGPSILQELTSDAPVRLPPDYLPASWSALAAAARDGIGLGVHSATHRSLPELPDGDLERELTGSRRALEERAGVTASFFAYPYGRWDARIRAAVESAGFQAAFTLDYGLARGPHADLWTLPRVNVPASIHPAAFQAWCTGLNLRRPAFL
ncbi:MAG TPA: polysaccharide deacetylase family protein [Gemmatimonadales bacterium]|nr:polysaccharide deacetylase family protein [Gemmatimonadales bacterium]